MRSSRDASPERGSGGGRGLWSASPATSDPGPALTLPRLLRVAAAIGALWITLVPGAPVRFLMATAGHLHLPARFLVDLLRSAPSPSLPSPPSSRSILTGIQAFYAAGLPAIAPRPGHRYLATAVLERDDARGLVVIDQTTGPVRRGDAVMIRNTLLGFVTGETAAGMVVTRLRREGVLLRVHVRLPDGKLVRALVEGDDGRPDLLRLRYPERPSLLRAGLPVVTTAQPATPVPSVEGDEPAWRVDVPGERFLGRLSVDRLRSEGAYRAFVVVAPLALTEECRAAVESSVDGGASRPYPDGRQRGYERLSARIRGACRVSGTGLDISAGVEAGVARGQAVSSGGSLVGRIDAVGLFASRVRRPLDGGLLLSVLSIGAGRIALHRFDLAPALGQFRCVGAAPGPAVGDWIVTSGADPGTPAGLAVGQVTEIDPSRSTGRCRWVDPSEERVLVWSKGGVPRGGD